MNSDLGNLRHHLHTLCLAGLLAGCAGQNAELATGPRQVSLAEFASPTEPADQDHDYAEAPDDENEAQQGLDDRPSPSPVRLGAGSENVDGQDGFQQAADDYPRQGLRLSQPGDRALVDSLIGQINGRPIFADDILLPIEDQLIAESRKSASPDEFARRAQVIVFEWMQSFVISELFLAEKERLALIWDQPSHQDP